MSSRAELAKVREALERIARTQEAEAVARDAVKADELAARNVVAQEESAHWAMVNVFVASAGLVLSAGGLLALLASLRLNRQAVRAAEDAVIVARESNAAQSRAWVSIVCVLSGPNLSRTHQGVEGVYFNVIGTAKNHGNSPATSVSFHAEIALLGLTSGSAEEKMDEYADRIRLRADHEAEAIFPGATVQVSHMVFLPLADIERSMCGKDFKMIAPVIYGCLNYKSPHVDGVRQTKFVYHVTSINEDGNAVVIRPDQHDWLDKPIGLVGPGTVVSD